MWPDCSPPRLKRPSRILAITARSPTAVRCNARPRSARKRSRPRLDITVATTPPPASCAVLGPGGGDQRHDLVAVDDLTLLVADHQPVGVAVDRDADVGAVLAHGRADGGRIGGAALVVDVEAVRIDANRDHLRAELVQRRRGHLVGRAVGAIDGDPEAIERQVLREGGLGDLDVAGRAPRRCVRPGPAPSARPGPPAGPRRSAPRSRPGARRKACSRRGRTA